MSLIEKGSQADLMREELASSLRRREFWLAAAREMVPVAGVFFFGWAAFEVAIFFLLESWLFLTSRCTLEIAADPAWLPHELPPAGFRRIWKMAGYFLGAGLLFGLLVGALGLLTLTTAFPNEDWHAFFGGGYAGRPFLAGLLLLLASEIYAGGRFAAQAATRGEEQRREDDHRILVMFYRCVALFACTAALGQVAAPGSLGGKYFVVLIALVMLYFEAFPRDIARRFGKKPSR